MKKKELAEHLDSMDLEDLMLLIIAISAKSYDGHFSVLSFTTNYRVGFGTPNCDFTNVKPFPDLKQALINAILFEPCW